MRENPDRRPTIKAVVQRLRSEGTDGLAARRMVSRAAGEADDKFWELAPDLGPSEGPSLEGNAFLDQHAIQATQDHEKTAGHTH